MEYKELYEYPISLFDVILSENDNEQGLYFVKCYCCEYLIGINNSTVMFELSCIPDSLSEALDTDLFPLLNKHITLLEWFRQRDYKGLNYNYEWEE